MDLLAIKTLIFAVVVLSLQGCGGEMTPNHFNAQSESEAAG